MAHKILIIDDELDMQIYLKTLFKKAGFEAYVAKDGEEGLRLARQLRPDLITLDILMPKRSGALTYEALRGSPETADIPVVILTGLPRHEQLFSSASAEVPPPNAVVEKPIDRDTFLDQITELIRAYSAK